MFSTLFSPKKEYIAVNNPYRHIEEIENFPRSMGTAFDLSWLEKYEINNIAASLVWRLHNLRMEQEYVNSTYFENIELRLCFSGKIIEHLKQTGEFYNAHQTGTSKGGGGKNSAIVEAWFLEMPFELFKKGYERIRL